MCSGVSPLAPGWLGSALFLPESSDCTRSRSPLMAAAESVLCCRLRSSPLKAGAVEGRTLSGSPLSRRVQEEVHAMSVRFAARESCGVLKRTGGPTKPLSTDDHARIRGFCVNDSKLYYVHHPHSQYYMTIVLQVARVARRRLANRALLGECRLGRAIGLFGSRCCLRLAVALRPTC